ncbi:MAG: hypothetical protein HZA05_06370 [Nitrospirae bacterium]|nr:hypothetical protein [Nitrospirota bacterium]
MNYTDFVYKKFRASEWESEVKTYIDNLSVPSNSIWYREDRDLKKASEELITLGYYVKYKFGVVDSIQFCLNLSQDAVDGWISRSGKQIESVQIVTAFYDTEEVEQDKLIMSGKESCPGGWEIDRFEALKARVEQRIRNKVAKKYPKIDTLVVGIKDWFARSVLENYSNLKEQLELTAKALLRGSPFKELAIVDTDLVGRGGLWLIPLSETRLPDNTE